MPDYPSPPPALFAQPTEPSAPYVAHSATSRAAAESVTRSTAQTDRERILAFLLRAGVTGATDEEGFDTLQMNPSTYRPRRIELAQAGRIVPLVVEGKGIARPTHSGRFAVVWVAATNPRLRSES